MKAALTQSSVKLRNSTVSKAQDYFSGSLDQGMAAMMSRLQAKVLGWQDDHISKQTRPIDSIAESTRACMRDELAPVISQSVEGCLHAHVQV